jgi:hypothetical protein
MKLSDETKEKIKEFYQGIEEGTDFDDAHEMTVDHLIDEEIVDLSDDEDGDMYEDLSNTVYEFLESLN